jgi:outer membrane cobalamin receptor
MRANAGTSVASVQLLMKCVSGTVSAGPKSDGRSQQPEVTRNDPVLPERSHYFDAGLTQKLAPGLEAGIDGYYKIARDLLDDGQFGQAYVLTGFNYDHATNYGLEFKASYDEGPLRLYGNLAWAQQKARTIVSNQFLFGADEIAYIASRDIFTDHAQNWTGSAGASYWWGETRFSADFIYGSGLRNGFANTTDLPAYTQVNLGASHEFRIADMKPLTVRFDVVNVFDEVYELRNGSGIGIFAPQFGPRRGFFVGLSQKF